MTAEPDLLPSSVAAFTEALKGERGLLDAWLEANDEREVAAHIEAYARANVAHATAPLQAEVEALRAEVERANSWNERVSVCRDHVADIVDGPCVICALDAAEARADNLQRELERLTAFNDDTCESFNRLSVERTALITRAERLAEALREAEKSLRTIADLAGGTEYLMTIGDVRGYANSRAYAARAALRDHDQENRND